MLLVAKIATLPVAPQLSGRDEAAEDWPQFGWDLSSTGASTAPTGITAANAASLTQHEIHIDGMLPQSTFTVWP